MATDEQNQQDETPAGENVTQNAIEPDEIIIEELRRHQDLNFALVGGFLTMIISALLWAVITVAAKYQIGYMALGVGLLVGLALRFFGAGIDKSFGYAGAAFALLGCILGNLFSQIGFFANSQSLGYFEAVSVLTTEDLMTVLKELFAPMDLLFYAIAAYEGYKFSFRRVTPELIEKISGGYEPVPPYNNLRRPLVIVSAVIIFVSYFMISRGVNGHHVVYNESGKKMAEGEFKNGKREGEWTFYYEDGTKEAVGTFSEGINDGKWKVYNEKGILTKISTFKKGLEHGVWITYYDNGFVSDSGRYENGRPEGQWLYYYESGKLSQSVNFHRNKPDGLWTSYFENGKISSSGNYKEGEKTGVWKTFYDNGNPESVTEYSHDELIRTMDEWDKKGGRLVKDGSGTYKMFNDAGKIIQTGRVENAERTGKWMNYYDDGKPREEWDYYGNNKYSIVSFWDKEGKQKVAGGNGEYTEYMPDGKTESHSGMIKNGNKDGIWKSFYPLSGKIQEEIIYKDGLMNGKQKIYYESGEVYVVGNMVNDKREGEWYWFYESGELQSTVIFKNGKKQGVQKMMNFKGEVVKEEYYENGNLVNEKVL